MLLTTTAHELTGYSRKVASLPPTIAGAIVESAGLLDDDVILFSSGDVLLRRRILKDTIKGSPDLGAAIMGVDSASMQE